MHKLITAIITPFDQDNLIDFKSLKKIIDEQISNNVDGLVINGTTAEAPTLSLKEKRDLVEFVIDNSPKDIELIVGVSSNDTYKVFKEIENVDDLAFDSYMVCPPYYNKTSQEGLVKHYEVIFEQTDKNFVIYNIPGRCGVNIDIDTMKKLCNTGRVDSIKEASGDMSYLLNLINQNLGVKIYNGNDDLILPTAAIGCDGLISAISNAIPREISNICKYLDNNNYNDARTEYLRVHELIVKTYEIVNPIGVKALVKLKYGIDDTLRLPLFKANDEFIKELKDII